MAIKISNYNDFKEELLLVIIYRSPNSESDNNVNLFALLNEICDLKFKNTIIAGDFNLPGIDWENLSSNDNTEMDFINNLYDNFLLQKVDEPTRIRGSDTPHILDLVLTNNDFVDSIEYLSPLGKSDHVILNIYLDCPPAKSKEKSKLNFNKGDYDSFRNYVHINWQEKFQSCNENIEDMWNIFLNVIDFVLKNLFLKCIVI